MNRQQVIARLRAHERELKEAGVVRLSVFGSVAREEEGTLRPRMRQSAEAEAVRAF